MYKVVMEIFTVGGTHHKITEPFDGILKGTKQEAADRALLKLMDFKYISEDTPNGARAIMTDHIVSVSIDILEEDET